MKALIKIVSMLLVLITVLSLCACAEETATPSKPTVVTDPVESTGGTDELVIKTQYLPAQVENPDDLPVLKWVCLMETYYGGRIGTWTEDAMHEVNQLLAERNMPFRVQFVLLTTNQFVWDMDWFSTPEAQTALQGADLITANLSPEEMQTLLTPITTYAKGETSPSLENAVVHSDSLRSTTVDGEIYAIPAYPGSYRSVGWEVNTDVLKNYGLSPEDFSGTFEEMDELFARIYEQNGSAPFLFIDGDSVVLAGSFAGSPSDKVFPGTVDSALLDSIHTVGSCFSIDYSSEAPRVVNYLEQDNMKSWQAALLRYREAGYTTANQNAAMISYTVCLASSVYTYVDDTDETNIKELVQIPVMKPLFRDGASGTIVSGICADTGNMEEALKLLNLIAEDEDFRLHLFYGKEGRDYTVEDGYYNITKTNDGYYSMDFISPLSYFCGLTSSSKTENVNVGVDYYAVIAADGKTKLETFRESLDNSTLCCAITFDFTGMDEKLTAMYNIMREYFPKFSYLTAEEYNQMLQELKNAGSETIQAQLQKQLDDWLAENPDWNS